MPLLKTTNQHIAFIGKYQEEKVIKQLRFIGIIVMFLLSFYFTDLSAQENLSLTIDDAVSLAMQKNKDILIAREERNKASQQVKEARSGAFPQISFNSLFTRTIQKPAFFLAFDDEVQKIEIGTDNSIQSSLDVNQLLYSGGKVGTAIEIARVYSRSYDELVEQTEKTVRLQVKQQYLAVLLTKEILNITKRNFEQVEAHNNQVQTLYSNGAASEFDALRAEVQVANILPKVISAENTFELNKNVLKNIIGLPLDQEIDIIGELKAELISEEEMSAAEMIVFSSRSDYKNLQLLREALHKRIKIEQSNNYPMASLNYNYQFQAQSNTFTFGKNSRVFSQSASVMVSLPIFDGFKTKAKVQQAEIDVRNMDHQISKLEEGIDIQIVQAKNQMNDALKRMSALTRTVEQAQKTLDIANVRFESGQGTQLEIFDAQIALETAKFNNLQSIFDYELSKAVWENAVGR
ncbi:TolC family protein [candidate division KSB1 bacterium]